MVLNLLKLYQKSCFRTKLHALQFSVFFYLVGRATRYGGISSYLDADIHKVDI